MSPIHILEAEEPDLCRLFQITSLAFQHHEPFWDLTYPFHSTPSGRVTGTRRFQQKQRADPTVVYTKALDGATGAIWGMARWHICDSVSPPEHEYLLEGGDPGYVGEEWKRYKMLSDAFMAARNDAVRESGGRIVVLDVLAVDPEVQGRGAGRALVEWGCGKADELGVVAVVESSKEGRRLYERCGFVWVRVVVVEGGVAGWGVQESAWMVRPKKGERR